jgi:hypothetical protein
MAKPKLSKPRWWVKPWQIERRKPASSELYLTGWLQYIGRVKALADSAREGAWNSNGLVGGMMSDFQAPDYEQEFDERVIEIACVAKVVKEAGVSLFSDGGCWR